MKIGSNLLTFGEKLLVMLNNEGLDGLKILLGWMKGTGPGMFFNMDHATRELAHALRDHTFRTWCFKKWLIFSCDVHCM